MLVLARKKGQSIIVQPGIEITVLDMEGDTVKIGVSAPREVQVMRKELLVSVQEENRQSVGKPLDVGGLSEQLKKMKKSLK
ncbi:carbon storage regulator [Cohnella soli]|uniref:Translational regulator CsrA n=1 Tax=Cohnella soli TaxID=425005 RepID=A0ABW0HML0_9BACL